MKNEARSDLFLYQVLGMRSHPEPLVGLLDECPHWCLLQPGWRQKLEWSSHHQLAFQSLLLCSVPTGTKLDCGQLAWPRMADQSQFGPFQTLLCS